MGISTPKIIFGKVMHGRLFPKKNIFTYGIYYLSLPLSQLKNLPIARNKFSPLSFHDSDHGNRDGSDLEKWARDILAQHNIKKADGEITLICMPRIFGYVFNPISFWLCHDRKKNIRAILCEVHNTFGENHTYLCAHADEKPIIKDDTLEGQKKFHVSPFLKREGHYSYQFNITDQTFDVAIDFYDGNNNKQLITKLSGTSEAMAKSALTKAIWRYPLITFKAIALIHWQALKLVAKGIKYIPKPAQTKERHSSARKVTKK